jgi:hypothetical protein
MTTAWPDTSRFRIVEEVDGVGKSRFFPERKSWFAWRRWTRIAWDLFPEWVSFDTRDEAFRYICGQVRDERAKKAKAKVETIIHPVAHWPLESEVYNP